jgi:hypothetical protein
MMMAQHIGVQCVAYQPLCRPRLISAFFRRYLPWAANSDARFVSVPERLASAPQHQQHRDSDLSLPLALVRGLFSQGLRMSACWSSAIQHSIDQSGCLPGSCGTAPSLRAPDLCAENEALYAGFEENGWPKFERRWHVPLFDAARA